MQTWWLTNASMTVRVTVNERGIVVDAAPVVRRFTGQPFRSLCVWMNKLPGFRRERLD